MYKARYWCLPAVLFVLWGMSACSKKETVYQSAESTLRSQTEIELLSIEWTPALYADGIVSKPVITIEASLPQALGAISAKKTVYPMYKNFGVLDVSRVPEKVLKTIDSFLQKAVVPDEKHRTIEQTFLNEEYPFLQMILTSAFAPLPPVSNWLYAKPDFIQDEEDENTGVWQIPVRLFCRNCYTDIVLFVHGNNGSAPYKIDQVYVGEQIYE